MTPLPVIVLLVALCGPSLLEATGCDSANCPAGTTCKCLNEGCTSVTCEHAGTCIRMTDMSKGGNCKYPSKCDTDDDCALFAKCCGTCPRSCYRAIVSK